METPQADISVRDTYALVLKAIDADDENPDQYLNYLDDQCTSETSSSVPPCEHSDL